MFNKKHIIRNFIFAFFCGLILIVSISLTYYISYFEVEEGHKQAIILEDEKKINQECNEPPQEYFINSIYFKLMAAFFAGGILSDGIFIKIGIV